MTNSNRNKENRDVRFIALLSRVMGESFRISPHWPTLLFLCGYF